MRHIKNAITSLLRIWPNGNECENRFAQDAFIALERAQAHDEARTAANTILEREATELRADRASLNAKLDAELATSAGLREELAKCGALSPAKNTAQCTCKHKGFPWCEIDVGCPVHGTLLDELLSIQGPPTGKVTADYVLKQIVEGERDAAIACAELLDRALAELDEPLRQLFKANGGVGLDSNPDRVNSAVRLIYDLRERAENAERCFEELRQVNAHNEEVVAEYLKRECDAIARAEKAERERDESAQAAYGGQKLVDQLREERDTLAAKVSALTLSEADEAALYGPCAHDMGERCPRCYPPDREPVHVIVNALRAQIDGATSPEGVERAIAAGLSFSIADRRMDFKGFMLAQITAALGVKLCEACNGLGRNAAHEQGVGCPACGKVKP